MTVIDDSFTRIAIRGRLRLAPPGVYTYFRWPNHGGPVDDVLFADLISGVGPSIIQWEAVAKLHYPDYEWEVVRVIVDVKPFSSRFAWEASALHQLRRQALGKLTPEERAALGLDEKTAAEGPPSDG